MSKNTEVKEGSITHFSVEAIGVRPGHSKIEIDLLGDASVLEVSNAVYKFLSDYIDKKKKDD